MLLKCCVILILFLNTISCDNEEPVATTTNVKKLLDIMNNPLKNRVQLTEITRRYLNEYNVVTKDGYILTIFRLTFENNEVHTEKFPVLMVHGLFQSSDRFLQQSESQSLAYKLQDFGYDVWLANFRGNKYGRRHTSFGPGPKDNARFFNYTYEEIALNDIAATVDFILEETDSEKLHYIGYSLGGTSFLVLNSMEPKYNAKFDTAHLLAPIGYQKYFPNSDLEVKASQFDKVYEELLNANSLEIFPYKPTNTNITFSTEECLGNVTFKDICNSLNINETMGLKSQDNKINETRGGSIKQLVHLAQNIKSKNFSRWDYGEQGNEEHYGAKQSPKYNLDLIDVPTTIIFAPNDEYVSPKDIADMAADMDNATMREVKRNDSTETSSEEINLIRLDFKHKDFIDAPDVMELVYDNIINDLEINSTRKAAIARQQLMKLKDDKNNQNKTNETKRTEQEELNDKIENTNWALTVVIPSVVSLALLFFVCLVRSFDFSCYTEL